MIGYLTWKTKAKEFCRCNLGPQQIDSKFIKRKTILGVSDTTSELFKRRSRAQRDVKPHLMSSISLEDTNCHVVERAVGQEMLGDVWLLRAALADSQQESGDLSCTIINNWILPIATCTSLATCETLSRDFIPAEADVQPTADKLINGCCGSLLRSHRKWT